MAVSCFYRAVLFLLLWFRICSGQSTQPPTLTPTESPTSAPTEVPTQPSSSPTVSPSIRPTASPSEVPTIAPSSPTFPPTTLPTSTPSTQQPTNAGVQVLLDSSVIRLGESYYSVDATEKYTWEQVPQSCICQQTGATPSSCSYFQCTCACDVHAGICDYGCCCDPDCSADQVIMV
jgi:cytoskeletal protein RodZ